MLEQVMQSIEPLLLRYGIWVALFLAIMIIIPVGIVIWLQKRRGHEEAEELSTYYEQIAGFRQQLNAWETSLSQNQQQANHYQGKTQEQIQPILQQLEQLLSRDLRLKSELHEVEALFGQDREQASGRLNDLSSEIYGLKPHLESITQWFKRLNQGIASSRSHIQSIENDLSSLVDKDAIQSLLERLESLKQETQPQDPLQQQSLIQKLQQDVKKFKEDAEASLPLEKLESEPVDAPQDHVSVQETQTTPDVLPEAESPEPLEEFTVNPSGRDLAEDILDELLQESEPLAKAQTEPLHLDSETEAKILSVLDTQIMSEDVSISETVEVLQSNTLDIAPVEISEVTAHDTIIEHEPLWEVEAFVPFAEADAELSVLPELLSEIEEAHLKLVQICTSDSDADLPRLYAQSQYRAAEAQELLKLARALYHLPQAPRHRAQLSLERMRFKLQSVQKIKETLEDALSSFSDNKDLENKYVENNLQTQ